MTSYDSTARCACPCHESTPPLATHDLATLTPAELEVAGEVASGRTNGEVAVRLGVTRATVKTHLEHIYTKLGVNRRAALALVVAMSDDTSILGVGLRPLADISISPQPSMPYRDPATNQVEPGQIVDSTESNTM